MDQFCSIIIFSQTCDFGTSTKLPPIKIECSESSPCPVGYKCVVSDEEPDKSYCEYDQSEPCDDESDPCPEGYECLSGKCVRINEELTKEFLQHPIQAEFDSYLNDHLTTSNFRYCFIGPIFS